MQLQVVEHRLAPGDSVQLQAAPRVAFTLADEQARFTREALTLGAPDTAVHALCFELVDDTASSSSALLRAPVSLDHATEHLIRCDRVQFPPGGVAYLHTHQGPGIRVLLYGSIRIETQGTSAEYGPLQAWFEPGPEPVFAAASATEPTAFVRCMLLPAGLLGASSIRYVRAEDADKPKPQRYTVFVDERLDAEPR